MLMTCLACLSFLGVSVYSGLRAMLVSVSLVVCVGLSKPLDSRLPPIVLWDRGGLWARLPGDCEDVAELGGGDDQKASALAVSVCVGRFCLVCVCVCVCIMHSGLRAWAFVLRVLCQRYPLGGMPFVLMFVYDSDRERLALEEERLSKNLSLFSCPSM